MNKRLVGYVIAGLLGLYLIRTVARGSPSEAVTTDNQTRVLRVLHDALVKQDAALLKAQRALHLRGVQAKAVADTASNPATQLVFMRQACSAFSEEAQTCQERASLLEVRIDTLESALRRQIGVSECRIIFLRCPSRGQLFAFGLLLGGAGGVFLAK